MTNPWFVGATRASPENGHLLIRLGRVLEHPRPKDSLASSLPWLQPGAGPPCLESVADFMARFLEEAEYAAIGC
jgi:hypothetical protein